MTEAKSFKERIKEEAIQCASIYKSCFMDYEYLVCSDAFVQNTYYIIQSHEDNYQHLIGVSASVSPEEFFRKCMEGSLEESDFSFHKGCRPEGEVKGSVRRKIHVLPEIAGLFCAGTLVEEGFGKNRIRCAFAAGNTVCTLGFSNSAPVRPMTLMRGNQLDGGNAKPVALVLRRRVGLEKFDEVVVGDDGVLRKYSPQIGELLSDGLREKAGQGPAEAEDEKQG